MPTDKTSEDPNPYSYDPDYHLPDEVLQDEPQPPEGGHNVVQFKAPASEAQPPELLTAALAYVTDRGWPVFPCKEDKTPYTRNGVLDATTDTGKIERWWAKWPDANIAVNAGAAGLMVLDLDPGWEPAALHKALGDLPKAGLHSVTPRGGEHLFFALDEDEIVAPSAGLVAENVDVRSFHSYVLLPPSRTAAGPYEWKKDGEPTYRTDEMFRVCNSSYRGRSENHDTWIIDADLPENINLATSWLERDAKLAVEGHNGDNITYATAAYMKSLGLSEEMAFDVMQAWNDRCSPPWDADELEQKIENAYAYNTSPPGNMTPAYRLAQSKALFKPVEVMAPAGGGQLVTSGRYEFRDALANRNIPPAEWIIGDWLQAGSHNMIIGVPGCGKTTAELDKHLRIAMGMSEGSVWGEIKKPGPVLYCVGEDPGGLRARQRAWEETYLDGRLSENFSVVTPVPTLAEYISQGKAALDPFISGALAISRGGFRAIVLDTVSRIMSGVNENQQEHVSQFIDMTAMIQRELGMDGHPAACTSIHHEARQVPGQPRGSVLYTADTDSTIAYKRTGDFISAKGTRQKNTGEIENTNFAQMALVTFGEGEGEVETVVLVAPDKDATPTKADGGAKGKPGPVAKTSLRVLDAAVVDILGSIKLKEWSNQHLADSVAMRPEIEVSGKTLEHFPIIHGHIRQRRSSFGIRLG